MKRFGKIFIVCYIITSAFFVFIFGNMNFFGEQGFHMTIDDFFYIISTWGLISGLILAGIIYFFTKEPYSQKK